MNLFCLTLERDKLLAFVKIIIIITIIIKLRSYENGNLTC
jgi:hypothetical protein